MSNKIGALKSANNGGLDEWQGEITTLHNHLSIRLAPTGNLPSGMAPAYKIFAFGSMGQETEVGAAWKKSKRKTDGTDFEFLSITIDDPSFPEKLNVVAFKNNQGSWDITWRRRQTF